MPSLARQLPVPVAGLRGSFQLELGEAAVTLLASSAARASAPPDSCPNFE